MKCQFCKQRCRLLKDGEPDYSNYEMTWLCEKHAARVLHHVRVEKYSLRRDHSIMGTTRNWNDTTIQWVNEKGQLLVAHFTRWDRGQPGEFIVRHVLKSSKGPWDDKINEIFTLEEHPKDFTPENIAKKVASYTIFS